MSQKGCSSLFFFVPIRVPFSKDFELPKTLRNLKKPEKCRRTPARFFNCRKTLVEKSRLDPDSLFEIVEEKHWTNLRKLLCAGRPLLNFLFEKKHFASGSRLLCPDPDPLFETARTLKNLWKPTLCWGTAAHFFYDWKTLVKTFHPKIAVIRSTSIYFGTTDREPSNLGT